MKKYFFCEIDSKSCKKVFCKTGSVECEYSVTELSKGESINLFPGEFPDGTVIDIEEVHSRQGGIFAYSVYLDGREIYFRDYEQCADALNGCFIRLPSTGNNSQLSIVCEYGKVMLHSVTVIEKADLKNEKMKIGFFTPKLYEDTSKTVSEINRICHSVNHSSRFVTAVSFEVYYMNRSNSELKEQICNLIDICKQSNVGLFINLNSWWSGTPSLFDGKGGRFTDFEYQQVTYDPVKRQYGFSVPNMWSSVPWLTMNCSWLNDARKTRISNVYKMLKQTAKEQDFSDINVFLDNEPAYWASFAYGGDADSGGDFSEWVRKDAEKDGVFFEDYTPLNDQKRNWLLSNMNGYITELACACGDSKVYTHVFPFANYPYNDTEHPQWETHITPYSRLGVESSTVEDSRIYDYAVRFGNFGNINAERACIHEFDYIKQNYLYGADISMIFNYRTEDTNNVSKQDSELDGYKVKIRDYPIPVLKFDAFFDSLDTNIVDYKDNIGIFPYRNRRGIRPINEGIGKIGLCIGRASDYGKELIIELWAFCNKLNGGIDVQIKDRNNNTVDIKIGEYCNEGSPFYLTVPLERFASGENLKAIFTVENNDFNADWCEQNYICKIRFLKCHRTKAGHTDGYTFTADEMRSINRTLFCEEAKESEICEIATESKHFNTEVGAFAGIKDSYIRIYRAFPQNYEFESVVRLKICDNTHFYLKRCENGVYESVSEDEIPLNAFGNICCIGDTVTDAYFNIYEFSGTVTEVIPRKIFPHAQSGRFTVERDGIYMTFSIGRECSVEMENTKYKNPYFYNDEKEFLKVGIAVKVRYTDRQNLNKPYRALSVR